MKVARCPGCGRLKIVVGGQRDWIIRTHAADPGKRIATHRGYVDEAVDLAKGQCAGSQRVATTWSVLS